MKILVALAILSGNLFAAFASDAFSEFSAPWSDATTAIVIDPYEQNDIDWDKLATDARNRTVKRG